MSYTQLTHEERYQISVLLKVGLNQTEIAMILERHKSTISREISRNTGLRGYRPKQAQCLAEERRYFKARSRISKTVWNDVRKLIREDWSPEQISLWFASEKGISISHEWIYQYILQDKQQNGTLFRHLRCQKQRRKRYGSYNRRGQLISIGRINTHFTHVQQVWTAVDSLGNRAMHPESADGEPATLKT